MSDSETRVPARVVAGRYRLVRELGRGGTGVVWLAVDELVGRPVAVKELRPPQLLADEEHETYGLRALAEARSAARIHHPGAVTLFDVLPASGGDDAVYLIMELVEGPTLAQLIEREGPLPAPAVASYGLQLLSVLLAAHGLGVVHRDIKPANIMIAPDGQAKLTDFGIAHTIGDPRLTRSGFMGTQAYTAPELFESAPLTPAADVWSLGATLFAAVQGQGPFDRDTTGATLRAILVDDLPAPRCPPPLAAAITGMLQRDPAQRSSIGEARGLLLAAAQLPGAAAADPAAASLAPVPQAGPASSPHVSWDQVATTRSPSAPPAAHPPPTAPPPSRSRATRRLLIIAAVAAAAVVTAAILVPVLLHSGSHQPTAFTRHNPAPAAPGPHPTLAATLSGPDDEEVAAVAFSPDGTMLATGSDDDSTYLWDVATHRIVATLTDRGGHDVVSVAFSPNGTMLAAGDSEGTTYVWDVATRSLVATLSDPGAVSSGLTNTGVTSVAFSPDGQTLASGDDNGSTYLWHIATRSITATLTDPAPEPDSIGVASVAFSPDGTMLAAGDADDSTYLWNVATRSITATLPDDAGSGTGVESVSFSPDGKLLAAGDYDASTYLWDVATRRLAATLASPPGTGSVSSVAFSPDGTMLAAGDTDTYLWDIATSRIVGTLTDSAASAGVNAVVFSPDGKMLAAGDGDGSTYLWDIG